MNAFQSESIHVRRLFGNTLAVSIHMAQLKNSSIAQAQPYMPSLISSPLAPHLALLDWCIDFTIAVQLHRPMVVTVPPPLGALDPRHCFGDLALDTPRPLWLLPPLLLTTHLELKSAAATSKKLLEEAVH